MELIKVETGSESNVKTGLKCRNKPCRKSACRHGCACSSVCTQPGVMPMQWARGSSTARGRGPLLSCWHLILSEVEHCLSRLSKISFLFSFLINCVLVRMCHMVCSQWRHRVFLEGPPSLWRLPSSPGSPPWGPTLLPAWEGCGQEEYSLWEKARLWLLLRVNFYCSSLPSVNVTLNGYKVCIPGVSRIFAPGFHMAFDKGFLDYRVLTGRLFQHSRPGLGQLYWGMLSLHDGDRLKAQLDIKAKGFLHRKECH